MKTVKTAGRFLIALLMGLVYMYILLSAAWNFGDMSTTEKVLGIVYIIMMIPVYDKLVKVLNLR
ncbi:MAG: hypothetical protein IJ606_02565 [Bacteroidaceae bacterium]|nr:hypothetical protein [Prevotella sp.]MBR1467495.1 hypothetical protein [Bacteroidaceae bacterium]